VLYILKVLSVSLLCVSFPLLAAFPPLYITLPADLQCQFFTTSAFSVILLLDFACKVIHVKKYNPQLTWMHRYDKSEENHALAREVSFPQSETKDSIKLLKRTVLPA